MKAVAKFDKDKNKDKDEVKHEDPEPYEPLVEEPRPGDPTIGAADDPATSARSSAAQPKRWKKNKISPLDRRGGAPPGRGSSGPPDLSWLAGVNLGRRRSLTSQSGRRTSGAGSEHIDTDR